MIKEGVIIGSRYEIMGRIGTGGMADVYKAIDRVLSRYVAVKVLKREFREDEVFVKKFRTEAQSAAGLSHPNIVNVYDVAEDRGLHYIVMELVEGITLKEYIQKKGKLTPKEVLGIALQVCSGIEAAHSNDIIHRDIKPQNIMISKEGKVKVTDFGIAKATSSNTISTNVMGSVHYTSPEQARGGFSDAKSDIYSLGITMYEMITGELPFDGDNTVSVALKHLQEDMTPPSDIVPDIPYSLEQIILKCTQKSPDRRYAHVALLIRDLKRSVQDPDGNFVKISPLVSVADTVMITPEELANIQGQAGFDSDYEDEYDEDYDDEEERVKKRESTKKEKNEIDPKMAKIMKILTIVITVIFVFILIFVIGKAAGIFKIGPDINKTSEKIVVPDLLGEYEEDAQEICEKAGLKLKVVKRQKVEKYEKGMIYKQKTQEGAVVQEGFVIHIEVSDGLLVEIPDLEDKDYIEARDALIDLGFDRSKIKKAEEPSEDVEEELVTRTDPMSGQFVTQDTEITIYISTGAEKSVMPNLIGKTKDEAEKALADAGLVGAPIEVFSDLPVGEVIGQDVDEGTEIEAGSTVEYSVSKGERNATIPTDLVGRTAAEAKTKLEELGFIVVQEEEASDIYNQGLVVYVEGAGYKVEKGSTVTIVVSSGKSSNEDNTQTPTM